jgi:hypothetical protein
MRPLNREADTLGYLCLDNALRPAMLRDRHPDPNPDADYSDRARHAQPITDKASPPRPKIAKGGTLGSCRGDRGPKWEVWHDRRRIAYIDDAKRSGMADGVA